MYTFGTTMDTGLGAFENVLKDASQSMHHAGSMVLRADPDDLGIPELALCLMDAHESTGRAIALMKACGKSVTKINSSLDLTRLSRKLMECPLHFRGSELDKERIARGEQLQADAEKLWESASKIGEARRMF